MAAFLTQNNQSHYCFFAASIPAGILVIVTWRLTVEIETNDDTRESRGFVAELAQSYEDIVSAI